MAAAAEDGRAARTFALAPAELTRVIEERDYVWVGDHGGTAGVARELQSSAETGLAGDEIAAGFSARIEAYGPNRFKYPPPKGFLRLIAEAFKDVTIIILCVAAVVSLIIGLALPDKREHFGYLEGVAIVIVVLVVVLVQACIDRQKEKKFRQLNSVKDNYDVLVKRAGNTFGVLADDVLVGDVVKLSAGDKVPADALLIEGTIKTNESAMTGEVIDVSKDLLKDPFILSGTTVSEGVAHVLLIAVGENSQWGVILSGLIVEPESTPLQDRLDHLAWTIGKYGIIIAVLTFFVSLFRWIGRSASSGSWEFTEVLKFFIDAVTIVVVAIPEGLPLAITLGLAFAMRKMMKDKNLVRRLEACETMGSATQLNADKTGTLTQNRMTVVEADWGGHHFEYGPAKEGAQSPDEGVISDEFRSLVATNVSVNSQANLHVTADGIVEHLGSKTECALLQLIKVWGLDYKSLRAEHKTSRIYMFDSTKKSMSSCENLQFGKTRLHTKGAPEMVVERCTRKLAADGTTVHDLDKEGRLKIVAMVDGMASRGLRTLLMCYRDVEHDSTDEEFWEEPPEHEMTFLGVVGIKDPIRPETREAVRLLKGAGVTVRMVTGDNALTARFIAKETGILDDDGIVMEGPEFRKLNEAEMDAVAIKIQVLARSTPNDKLTLVRAHKKLGEVVAVTGDGTNDAPALKEADVGFALGMAGTEIAKEACDIVIMDDNIQSMSKAVLWGRNVYESIRKFLQFQLVVNIVAVTLNFLSACAGVPLPLSAVPLLWVNMIMDSMGALALATEPPRPQLMDRKPFGRRAPLINRAMYRNIIGISIYQLVVCLVLQYAGGRIFGLTECLQLEVEAPSYTDCPLTDLKINSIIFNVFVFMQIGSEINSRRIAHTNVFAGIHKSYLFLMIIFITVLIQVAIMLGVAGTNVGVSIGIEKISLAGWGTSVVLGALILPWGALVRMVPLEWCVGPMDEDPTQMSKLETLLRIPKRKLHHVRDEEELEMKTVESEDVDQLEPPKTASEILLAEESAPSAARLRLRVFVHAVAFVNVVSKARVSRSSAVPADDSRDP